MALEDSVVDTLLNKTISLSNELGINKVPICGGVSANDTIKDRFLSKLKNKNINFYYPEKKFSTDNAAMIACCGYYKYINNIFSDLLLNANANLNI